MGLVTVEQAAAGMTLAAPVTDKRGRLLIPADAELTERHVQALKMWGVEAIEVVGDGPEQPALAVTPEVEAHIREIVVARFGDQDLSHPFLAALEECAVRRAVASGEFTEATE